MMLPDHPCDEPRRIDPNDAAYLARLPACVNCGQLIYAHEKESEPPWMCPWDYQQQPIYGYFNGGDPREFHPDAEGCTPDELKRHKEACEAAYRMERNRNLPCPSGWERWPDGTVAHVTRAPFGIGLTTFPVSCYQAPWETENE